MIISNNKIKLKIITPNGILIEKMVDIVIVKTISGYIGILYNHISLISTIVFSELVYYIDNIKFKLNIAGGILQVKKEFVKILTDYVK